MNSSFRGIPDRRSLAEAPLPLLASVSLPWGSAKSPCSAHAAASTLAMARKAGLALGDEGKKVFDGFAECAAFGYANAEPERLAVCSDWCAWLWFLDDELDTLEREPRAVADIRDEMTAALDVLRSGVSSVPASAFSLYTAALRAKLLRLAPEPEVWLSRFCNSVSDYLFQGALHAVDTWAHGRVPTLETYLVQREYDSSMHACIDLIEVAGGFGLPDDLYERALLRKARQLTARVVAFVNDLFSFEREVLVHRNPNNLLCVLMQSDGAALASALRAAADIINSDVAAFVAIKQDIRCQTWGNHPAVAPYLRGMKLWMRGNYDWSATCDRYASPTSPFLELRREVA